jgi:hypothetical protein
LLTRNLLALCALLAAAPAAVEQTDVQTIKPMSQHEMEGRVRIEAGRYIGMAFDQVRVVETRERTWPDRGLGCNARRGVLEPMPTPGFLIVVQAGARRLTYHTDRFGRVLRCAAPTKPLDPIK